MTEEPKTGHDADEGGRGGRMIAALLLRSAIGALCARDYKGAGSQYVREGKLIVELWTETGTEE